MRRVVATALVGLVVLAACGAPPAVSTTTTASASTTLPSTSTTSTSGGSASQTPGDALRDGVLPALAELPYEVRVGPIESIETAEGTWIVSRPPEAIDAYTKECRLGAEIGRYPTDFICTTEYGELLLVRDGVIVRAYPFPGAPPEFLIVTDDTVYCARGSEPRLPDTMVCRIDRASLEALVRVFPGEIDSVVTQPCFYPPERWSVHDRPLAVNMLQVDDQGLRVSDSVVLDAATLEPMGNMLTGRLLNVSVCRP